MFFSRFKNKNENIFQEKESIEILRVLGLVKNLQLL